MIYFFTILVWNKSDLPSNWNGERPVHVNPIEESVDAKDLSESRNKIQDAHIRLRKENKHYQIFENGRRIYSSHIIPNY